MNLIAGQYPTIGIVGAGHVGSTLGLSLKACGFKIVSVFSRTPEHADSIAQQLDSRVATSAAEVLTSADLTLLTVSDDVIEEVAAEAAKAIKAASVTSQIKAVVHTSGAYDRQVLAALQPLGWMTGSLHPALPFAATASSRSDRFYGVTFALEADDERLLMWMEQIAQALGANAFRLKEGQKVLYHTALAMASNYTVSLYGFAEQLLTQAGFSESAAAATLNALLQATVTNLEKKGIPEALTGPLVRNDTGTVSQHLRVLHRDAPAGVNAYRALARLTYPLLTARGISTFQIEHLLQQDEASWQD